MRAEAARTLAYCNTPLAHQSLQNAPEGPQCGGPRSGGAVPAEIVDGRTDDDVRDVGRGAGTISRTVRSSGNPPRMTCRERTVCGDPGAAPADLQLCSCWAQVEPVDTSPWVPLTQWSDIPVGSLVKFVLVPLILAAVVWGVLHYRDRLARGQATTVPAGCSTTCARSTDWIGRRAGCCDNWPAPGSWSIPRGCSWSRPPLIRPT